MVSWARFLYSLGNDGHTMIAVVDQRWRPSGPLRFLWHWSGQRWKRVCFFAAFLLGLGHLNISIGHQWFGTAQALGREVWSNEKKQRGCQVTKQHVYYRVYIGAKMIAAVQRTSEQQMQDTPVLLRYLTYLRILTGEVFIVAIRQKVELQ